MGKPDCLLQYKSSLSFTNVFLDTLKKEPQCCLVAVLFEGEIKIKYYAFVVVSVAAAAAVSVTVTAAVVVSVTVSAEVGVSAMLSE